jgi:hypothetical protein
VGGDTGKMHLPTSQFDEEENVQGLQCQRLRLDDADDVAERARWPARDQPQSGCQNSQGQFLCPVWFDWLVAFPFQDSQLSAQEEDFQVFFLLGQTADTHKR